MLRKNRHEPPTFTPIMSNTPDGTPDDFLRFKSIDLPATPDDSPQSPNIGLISVVLCREPYSPLSVAGCTSERL